MSDGTEIKPIHGLKLKWKKKNKLESNNPNWKGKFTTVKP